MHPSKWDFKDFIPCSNPVKIGEEGVGFFIIFLNVIFEAFLWGAGTAIGELPPYYMAKAAAETGKSSEEIEEIRQIQNSKNKTFIEKVKEFLYVHLRQHGFITVLLCASVK